ncbi:MAG: transposase [Candidatus Aminicenantes bacterium]|nr:transposase [Candidatus Aminicenantes bacterium]
MKDFPQRKQTRLKNFNYSEYRIYFITICTKDRNPSFGRIIDDKMKLSKIGEITEKCWLEIPDHFPDIELMDFVIMPDHFHGILKIYRYDKHANSDKNCRSIHNQWNRHAYDMRNSHGCSLQPRNHQRLPVIIGSFKSSVTRIVKQLDDYEYFAWQKSYYDLIIRNSQELKKITKYILTNPQTWSPDEH